MKRLIKLTVILFMEKIFKIYGSVIIRQPECVFIGNHCVIGAGSVVTKDVPDNCVMAGVPAQLLRKLETKVRHKDRGDLF